MDCLQSTRISMSYLTWFHILAIIYSAPAATAPDRVDPFAGDGGGPGVRPVSAGGAGRGESGVPHGDGEDTRPAGVRQPRGLSVRRPAEHDAETEGETAAPVTAARLE